MRKAAYFGALAGALGLGQVSVWAAPPVEKASKPTTRLYVATDPAGADVKLDGKRWGTSPHLFLVPPGVRKLTVEVELDGHYPQQQEVQIRGGWITRVELELEKRPAASPARQSGRPVRSPQKVLRTPVREPKPVTQSGQLPEVNGVVTAVDGPDLIEIDIGSGDGLRVGHKLQVYRRTGAASSYVGRVEVVKIDADKAVCRVDHRLSRICKGDLVASILRSVPPVRNPLSAARPGKGPAKTPTRPPSRVQTVRPAPGPVERALCEKTTLEIDEVSLSEVVKLLGKQLSNVLVILDHRALEDVGISADTPLSVSLSNVSMQSALELALRDLDLTWTIRHGALLITTPEEAENRLLVRYYPVGDLTSDCDTLIELITTSIDSDSWDEVGGLGSIVADTSASGAALVISQTHATHQKVRSLLTTLRSKIVNRQEKKEEALSVDDVIEQALAKPISLDLAETPLSEMAKTLGKGLDGVNVVLDRKALEDVGIDADVPVTIRVADLPLRSALNLALSPLDLTWVVHDEVLLITTEEEAENLLSVKLYDVTDLPCDFDVLSEIVKTTVVPGSWDDLGGPGSMSVATFGGTSFLVTAQTGRLHYEIAELLEDLQTMARQPGAGKVPEAIVRSGFQPMTPATEAIRKALASKISMKLVEAPLTDVVAQLHRNIGINIIVDQEALEDVGIGTDVPITTSIEDVTLETWLRLILRQLDLTWVIRDEFLVITTPEEAENRLITGVYPVTDLIARSDATGQVRYTGDFLVEVLQTTICPDTWDEVGGPAHVTAQPFDNFHTLVVSQTADVHEDIGRLFSALREIARRKAQGGPTSPIFPDDPDGSVGDAIRKALKQKAAIDLVETPLREALSAVSEKHGVQAQVDQRALEDVGIDLDTRITVRISSQVSLKSVLALMLDPLDLTIVVEDGVLQVTTPEEAENRLALGLYPVADLVAHRNYLSLMKMITTTIMPDSWDEVGGAGSIAVGSSDAFEVLVIAQTAEIHEQIAALLANLGETAVWTCSMHPQIKSPKSGKCPICAMDLIPLAQYRSRRPAGSRRTEAQAQMASIHNSLQLYQLDLGTLPKASAGLKALSRPPADLAKPETWSGPYLKGPIPVDPWGNPYHYAAPGKRNPRSFDLWSAGPDGVDGTADDVGNGR